MTPKMNRPAPDTIRPCPTGRGRLFYNRNKAMPFSDTMTSLPDPHHQPEFYANVPAKRLMAWIVDCGIGLVLTLLVLPFTFFIGLVIFPLLWLMISFAYRVVTLANGSATWGMRFFAIELRRHDGQRFDLQDAFLHTLTYSVSLTLLPVQVLTVIAMLTTPRGQGLTDMLFGTVALNRRAR